MIAAFGIQVCTTIKKREVAYDWLDMMAAQRICRLAFYLVLLFRPSVTFGMVFAIR